MVGVPSPLQGAEREIIIIIMRHKTLYNKSSVPFDHQTGLTKKCLGGYGKRVQKNKR